MEKATLFTRCMWLITTINAAGAMTKAEIDAAWRRSSVNDAKETEYHERSLRRHRDHCYKFFGIAID